MLPRVVPGGGSCELRPERSPHEYKRPTRAQKWSTQANSGCRRDGMEPRVWVAAKLGLRMYGGFSRRAVGRSPPHSPHGASSRRFGNEIILVALQVEGRHCLPGEDRAKYDLRMNGHGSVRMSLGMHAIFCGIVSWNGCCRCLRRSLAYHISWQSVVEWRLLSSRTYP